MQTKTVDVKFKAGPQDGLADGEFIAYFSTFDRKPDSYGDVVSPGAFLDSMAEWRKSGNILPGYYGHRLDDPDYNVAGASDYGEDQNGAWVRGKFDLENQTSKASQVYRLVKGKRLNQLSFSFDVVESGKVTLEDGTKANELRKLSLYEFSFVPIGANQNTSIVAVKSALADLAKAGRVLSSKNETDLRDARDLIDKVLATLDEDKARANHGEPLPHWDTGTIKDALATGESTDDGNVSEPAKAEEPEGAKAEEPMRGASPDSWAAILNLNLIGGQ